MTPADLLPLLTGTVQGIVALTVFLLAVLIGACLLLDRTKLRPTRGSRTVRNLDERLGQPATYLPPEAPRGVVDQLAGSRQS